MAGSPLSMLDNFSGSLIVASPLSNIFSTCFGIAMKTYKALLLLAATGIYMLGGGMPALALSDSSTDHELDITLINTVHSISAISEIVINEISYNQPNEMPTGDWVELFNPGAEPVDLSGWVFKDESDDHAFTLPSGTVIAPYGYVVVCEDMNAFRQFFPDVNPVLGSTGFGLSGSGELVRLFNSSGDIVDSLTYDDKSPWPKEADGDGPTLELISASYDNALGQSWKASQNNGGTPGRQNSSTTDTGSGTPQNTQLHFLQQNYPNPFSASSVIGYVLLTPAHVTIEVFNALGQPVLTLFDEDQGSGAFSIPFDATSLATGHYLYGLRINGELVAVKSAILIK